MDLLNLPAQQIVIYLAIGIGTAIAAALSYQKGKKEQAEPAKDVIIREASIADWGVMREIATHAKAGNALLGEIRGMLAEEFRKRAEREEEARDAELARLRQVEAEMKAKEAREGFRPPRRGR
jgi:hypothetical protein